MKIALTNKHIGVVQNNFLLICLATVAIALPASAHRKRAGNSGGGASGGWIIVANIPMPNAGTMLAQNTQYDLGSYNYISGYNWYKTYAQYKGGYIWAPIDRGQGGPTFVLNTTQTTGWNVSIGVTGEGEIGLPVVANGKISVSLGAGWETSTSHSMTSGPGGQNSAWRFGHYQKTIGMVRSVNCKHAFGSSYTVPPTTGWTPYSQSSFTGSFAVPVVGKAEYLETSMRKPLG